MKYKFSFFLSILFISCSIFKKNEVEFTTNDYEYFEYTIKSYFINNFRYPNNIDDLINYHENTNSTIKKMLRNGVQNYTVKDSVGYLVINYKSENVISVGKTDICSSLNKNKLYLPMIFKTLAYHNGRKIKFGNEDKNLDDSLNIKIKNIMSRYKKKQNLNYQYVKIYKDSIYYKCHDDKYNANYIKEVKSVFKELITKTKSDSIKLIIPVFS